MGWSHYRPTGLTHHHRSGSYKGYTLITPVGGDSTFLLGMEGRVVHRWRFTDVAPFYGRLLESGNLLVLATDLELGEEDRERASDPSLPLNRRVRGLGGNASLLREVSWEGEPVWEYRNEAIHHDFVRLPSGNTLAAEWVDMPGELGGRVRGGVPDRRREKPPMLGDDIVEIDPSGREVWRVSVHDLLDPRRDPICPLESRVEWTHLNALDVNADGDVLFSCRINSRVGIIDRVSGTLRWKHGFPDVSHQHNATWLPNGNVQIFDNGMHRRGLPRSRVVEINPATSETVWEYSAQPEEEFFSAHISSAERLPNGNVLVCEGAAGRLFEITPRGEVVWEWVNPIVNTVREAPSVAIFRAHRYGPDFPALSGRALDPRAHFELNRLHGLGRGAGRRMFGSPGGQGLG
ncbi:MAG: aryl-sulfate sulfotransferase [Dehalococcoidia bacterium]